MLAHGNVPLPLRTHPVDPVPIEAQRLGLVEAWPNRPVMNRLSEIRDQHLEQYNVEESKDLSWFE